MNHLSAFRREGTGTAVLTPHLLVPQLPGQELRSQLWRLRLAYDALAERLADAIGLPAIQLGQEVLAPTGADAARVAHRHDVGLGSSSAVLVELGFGPGHDAPAVIDAFRAAGRTPVFAHVERYYFHDEPLDELARWRDLGAVLQVNAGSLIGYYGEPVSELGWQVLRAGLGHLVASDNHGESRPHRLSRVRPLLEGELGADAACRLLAENPGRVLAEEAVLSVEPRVREHTAA